MVQSTFAKFYLRDMEKQQKNLQLLGSVVAAKKMVGARCSGRSQEVNKAAQLSCSWCQTIKGNRIVKLYWCFQGSKWRSCREKCRFLIPYSPLAILNNILLPLLALPKKNQDLSLDRTFFFLLAPLKWRETPNPPV